MMRFIYNLFMPIGFLFFVPGLYLKFRNRGGWKGTFAERFGHFTKERIAELSAFHGAIWIHAVSVGECMVALSLLREYRRLHPERKFVLSTTTTTGQELARKQSPEGTAVIFCPIDFLWMVRKTLRVLKPAMLVIFETKIWPANAAVPGFRWRWSTDGCRTIRCGGIGGRGSSSVRCCAISIC